MILLNLFTAVVLENFQVQEEQAEWTLTPAALEVVLVPIILKNAMLEQHNNVGLLLYQ